jgi:hypothetical protein
MAQYLLLAGMLRIAITILFINLNQVVLFSQDLIVKNSTAEIGNLLPSEKKKAFFSVENTTDSIIYLELESRNRGVFLDTFRYQIAPKSSRRISVKCNPPDTAGSFTSTVALYRVWISQNSGSPKALRRSEIAILKITGNATQKAVPVMASKVRVSKLVHDFGTILEGPHGEVLFTLSNLDSVPVHIVSANSSCGCLTATWPREPIQPGQEAKVKLSYYTEGRPGYFNKGVKFTLSNGAEFYLTVVGTVEREDTYYLFK